MTANAIATTAPSRSQWLSWRRTGIGGSDAPVVAGVSPYKSRVDLWLEKTGRFQPLDIVSPPQRWGLLLEDAIAAALKERIDCEYVGDQVCVQSDDRPWQLATLDRLTAKNEIVELKSVSFAKARTLGDDGDVDSLPDEWHVQAQHQMAATGFGVVIFGVFVGTMEDVRIYEVERNDSFIDALNGVEEEFWESVRVNEPPPLLDARDAEAVMKHLGIRGDEIALPAELSRVVDDYHEIKDRINELDAVKSSLRSEILKAMNGSGVGVLPDGRIVKCGVTEISESTRTVKAHKRVNLSFRNPRTS